LSVLLGAAFAVLIAGGARYRDLVVGDREALLARYAWLQAAREAAQDGARRAGIDALERAADEDAGTESGPPGARGEAAEADSRADNPTVAESGERPRRGTMAVPSSEAVGRRPAPRVLERDPEPGGWIERNLGAPKGTAPSARTDADGGAGDGADRDAATNSRNELLGAAAAEEAIPDSSSNERGNDDDDQGDNASASRTTPDGPIDLGPSGTAPTPDVDDTEPRRETPDRGGQDQSGWQDEIVAAIDAVLADLPEDGDREPSDAEVEAYLAEVENPDTDDYLAGALATDVADARAALLAAELGDWGEAQQRVPDLRVDPDDPVQLQVLRDRVREVEQRQTEYGYGDAWPDAEAEVEADELLHNGSGAAADDPADDSGGHASAVHDDCPVPDPLEQARQALADLQAASAQRQRDHAEGRAAELNRWHVDDEAATDGTAGADRACDDGEADAAGWER
jgi:hypothetical protein